jgi:hypothetical protein
MARTYHMPRLLSEHAARLINGDDAAFQQPRHVHRDAPCPPLRHGTGRLCELLVITEVQIGDLKAGFVVSKETLGRIYLRCSTDR